jgi:hypothetical protein
VPRGAIIGRKRESRPHIRFAFEPMQHPSCLLCDNASDTCVTYERGRPSRVTRDFGAAQVGATSLRDSIATDVIERLIRKCTVRRLPEGARVCSIHGPRRDFFTVRSVRWFSNSFVTFIP